MNLDALKSSGFDVRSVSRARTTLVRRLPGALHGLCHVLSQFYIEDVELVRSGGGLSQQTRRLRNDLIGIGWEAEGRLNLLYNGGVGSVVLRIAWNSKNTTFDRDLEDFQRLHTQGRADAGIIVTRGASLQESLELIVRAWAQENRIQSFDALTRFGVRPTQRQLAQVPVTGPDFPAAWAPKFVADKFSSTTTHWEQLQARVDEEAKHPCPLLLLGIPAASVRRQAAP